MSRRVVARLVDGTEVTIDPDFVERMAWIATPRSTDETPAREPTDREVLAKVAEMLATYPIVGRVADGAAPLAREVMLVPGASMVVYLV